MLALIGTFSIFDRAGMNPPGLIGITLAITYVVGTLQWFLVGGGVGAILERFFEGLRTPDPEEQEWD
jgi:fructose-specific phosphotransferase system IIC component